MVLALAGCGRPAHKACLADPPVPDPQNRTAGMVRLTGGEFQMGAAPLRPEEGPPQTVKVAPFWIDQTEVTNAAFARFVDATGYRTVAERTLDPARYAHVPAAQRRPASLVFVGAKGARSDDPSQWWRVIPGADWRHPEGPGSNIRDKDAWPVVHIAWEDAMAYAKWLGRDLPTEAEWEYAARGGLVGKRYTWGDQAQDPSQPRANTWQGVFPAQDLGDDGFKARPAPVGCFPPNGYGLRDMAGNVWEWTRDWFKPGLDPVSVIETGGPPEARALDPEDPSSPKHVVKGGSFLCADDYCFRYRPAARTPGPPDSGASHVGFRTVLRAER
jgi:formylglycine-generating enzyme required for sulfatase activity